MPLLRVAERFTSEDLFNLPIAEGFFLLDVRPAEAYTAAHITTSWNLPAANGGDESAIRTSLLQLVETSYDINPPEQLTTVVICYDAGCTGAVVEYATAVAAEVASFAAATQGGNSTQHAFDRTLHSFASTLFARIKRVAIFDRTEAFCEVPTTEIPPALTPPAHLTPLPSPPHLLLFHAY